MIHSHINHAVSHSQDLDSFHITNTIRYDIKKEKKTEPYLEFEARWALSIYEKNPEISVVAKVEFPIGKKLFHLVVNPGTWRGARPWTWNWYKLRET